MNHVKAFKVFIISLILLLPSAVYAAGEETIVVELFSSQSCPACPPANDLLDKIADKDDVFVLSWQVDYWDYMGWRDTFAKAGNTERQAAYNQSLGKRGVMTPEFVIHGQRYAFGSQQDKVEALVSGVSQDVQNIAVTIIEQGEDIIIEIAGSKPLQDHKVLEINLIPILPDIAVEIGAGDNEGRLVRYRNVVLDYMLLGLYDGKAQRLIIPKEDFMSSDVGAVAVLLQHKTLGPIQGIGHLGFDD